MGGAKANNPVNTLSDLQKIPDREPLAQSQPNCPALANRAIPGNNGL
jgi:hypothetical protein